MPDNLLQRWTAAWIRLVDRVPLSDHAIAPELPAEAYGVATPAAALLKPTPLPDAPATPESR